MLMLSLPLCLSLLLTSAAYGFTATTLLFALHPPTLSPHPNPSLLHLRKPSMSLHALDGDDEKYDRVEVGSKEYYKGFIESPLKPAEGGLDEVDGDRFRQEGLEQALKLGGGATAVLALLFLGFMGSNGLL
mmetsp:Transcript_813/g.1462  ORF Transcript_813/g.1462 Transcript_813/m.1462 type:complete len:131 (-) Transcript_813:44-436(-)